DVQVENNLANSLHNDGPSPSGYVYELFLNNIFVNKHQSIQSFQYLAWLQESLDAIWRQSLYAVGYLLFSLYLENKNPLVDGLSYLLCRILHETPPSILLSDHHSGHSKTIQTPPLSYLELARL